MATYADIQKKYPNVGGLFRAEDWRHIVDFVDDADLAIADKKISAMMSPAPVVKAATILSDPPRQKEQATNPSAKYKTSIDEEASRILALNKGK